MCLLEEAGSNGIDREMISLEYIFHGMPATISWTNNKAKEWWLGAKVNDRAYYSEIFIALLVASTDQICAFVSS